MFGRRFLFPAGAVLSAGSFAVLNEKRQASSSAKPAFDRKRVGDDIVAAIEKEDARRDDGTSIAPTLVRLAWHASGTYSTKDGSGGSNGSTMRMSPEKDWGANAGLAGARSLLQPIAEKHAASQSDVWTLAGCVAIESMGGPEIKWRPGRSDSPTPTTVPDGRLPDADKGAPQKTVSHIRTIFSRMGFSDQEVREGGNN